MSFTVVDWTGRSSATAIKMPVQTGKEEAQRISRAGVPLTPKPKEAVKVHIEMSKEEFVTLQIPEKWKEFRADAVGFLKIAIEDLIPLDHVIEHARRVNWGHWDSEWEMANATIFLAKRGYDIVSKRAIERGIFPRFFLVTAKANPLAFACSTQRPR